MLSDLASFFVEAFSSQDIAWVDVCEGVARCGAADRVVRSVLKRNNHRSSLGIIGVRSQEYRTTLRSFGSNV